MFITIFSSQNNSILKDNDISDDEWGFFLLCQVSYSFNILINDIQIDDIVERVL